MAARKKVISHASNPSARNSKPATRDSKPDAQPSREQAEALKASKSNHASGRHESRTKENEPEAVAAAKAAKETSRNSAMIGKPGAMAPSGGSSKIEVSANATAKPAKAGRKSKAIETQKVEMKPVSALGAPGKLPGVTGVAAAAASAAVVNSGTDAGSALVASAFASPRKLAAPKAAPASAKSDRDEQNGEQKAMKTSTNRHGFKLNEFVVYPAHGVGQVVSIEEQEVAGFKLELFVINFVKDKMTLRVPTAKVAAVGMRKLSDADAARRSLDILTGRARVKRTMWSRRAQEYEAKINSGDINAIAEVVRDLFRSDAQPEQSYSERQLYEAALDRMMREIAAVYKLTETEGLKMIEGQLKKNAKRAPKAETAGAEADADDTDIEEAA